MIEAVIKSLLFLLEPARPSVYVGQGSLLLRRFWWGFRLVLNDLVCPENNLCRVVKRAEFFVLLRFF